jgi:hypothetical protein
VKRFKLSESGDRGWFIGAFDRAVWKTDKFEVSYQFNPKDDVSPKHVHMIAKELSLITEGHVVANGEHFVKGDIFEVSAGENLECFYLEDTYTVCIKVPSVLGDKYYV